MLKNIFSLTPLFVLFSLLYLKSKHCIQSKISILGMLYEGCGNFALFYRDLCNSLMYLCTWARNCFCTYSTIILLLLYIYMLINMRKYRYVPNSVLKNFRFLILHIFSKPIKSIKKRLAPFYF